MRGYSDSECRRAEDRILRDIANAEAAGIRGGQGRAPEDVQADAGSGLAIFIVCVVAAGLLLLCGCGTINGLGSDLQQWSNGIRGSVQNDQPAR